MKSKILTFLLILGCCGFAFSQSCGDCPVITVDLNNPPAFPTEACAGSVATLCLDAETPAAIDGDCIVSLDVDTDVLGTISVSGAFVGSQICVDVPIPENPNDPCTGYAVTVTGIQPTVSVTCASGACAAGTLGVIADIGFPITDCDANNLIGLLPGFDPITVFPNFTENIVPSTCAGVAGMAQLLSITTGAVCAMETVSIAGVENVCPATADTDAELTYDFTGFTNMSNGAPCFTGTSGVPPIDCALPCAACPNVTAITPNATEVCSATAINVCVDFDADADGVMVDVNGVMATGVAGDLQICVDVPTMNMGCGTLPLTYAVVVTCDNAPLDIAGLVPADATIYPDAGFTVVTNDDGSTCGTPQIEVFAADASSCGTVDGTACATENEAQTLDGATLLTAPPAALACQLPDLTADVTCTGCGVCTVVAGEPAIPATDVCPAGQGPGPNGEMELTPTMDNLMTLSMTPAPTGTNATGTAPTTNYVITNAAGEVLDVVGNVESMTYDFSPYYGAVGSSFCVYQAAYTQETIDDIAMALNDVLCTTLCAPGFGCVGDLIGGCPVIATPAELAGVLDVLNSVFTLVGQPLTAADVDNFLANQTITIPTGSIPGLGPLIGDFDFNLADFGLDICGDLSNMGACFNVVACTVACDVACANDVFIQIESIEIIDPVGVVGELNPFGDFNGCAGAGTFDGVDGFIELDIVINGNAVAQISVDGGTAGVTAGPFGAAVAAGTTACGDADVTASVAVSDDDSAVTGGADDLTTNATEAFALGGGTFTACDGNIVITYSTTCTVDCTACVDCPAITAVDTPVDGCDATMQTVCVTYDQDPTGLVTADINGVVGTIDAAAMTICYDIPLANTTCDPAMLDFVHTAICVADSSPILNTAGADTNGSIGMINVYPVYDVVVVPPVCDGAAGSAEVQVNGVACATPVAVTGTAGVTNVCPAPAPGTPATLTYDFSADANIVAATAAGCAPTGAALMDAISTACDLTCNATCDITAITAGAPVCSADGTTYDVTVTVTGTDASVMLDDGTGPVAAMTTTFTFASGAGYTINVTDTDGVCAFGPFTGADPGCTAAGPTATITDPCNCTNGIDTDGDASNGLELAAETITITDPAGTGEIWTLTANNGELVEMDGMTASSGTATDNGDGTYTFSGFVLADGATIYTASFTNGAGDVLMIEGGPCSPCPVNIPTVGEWGLIILGLLMSITAVVGIRQRREEEVYS